MSKVVAGQALEATVEQLERLLHLIPQMGVADAGWFLAWLDGRRQDIYSSVEDVITEAEKIYGIR